MRNPRVLLFGFAFLLPSMIPASLSQDENENRGATMRPVMGSYTYAQASLSAEDMCISPALPRRPSSASVAAGSSVSIS